MEAIPGLEEFLSRQSPGRKSAALDTTVVEAAAAREDPLLPESMVAIHNAARRVHGANNLTWSTVLAKEAEELAGKCEKGALSSGINVARGQGIDFAQASISWCGSWLDAKGGAF